MHLRRKVSVKYHTHYWQYNIDIACLSINVIREIVCGTFSQLVLDFLFELDNVWFFESVLKLFLWLWAGLILKGAKQKQQDIDTCNYYNITFVYV